MEIGDVVMLKSGSAKMTVTSIQRVISECMDVEKRINGVEDYEYITKVSCIWFAGTEECSLRVPEAALDKVEE